MSAQQSVEVDKLFSFIKPLAIKAGEMLLEGYNSKKNVEIKSDFYDVVTEYDNKIENYLMQQILASYPHHKFVAEEESSKNNATAPLTDAPTWIIDPIDGTSNFIKMLPHTCVSIGLAINKEIVLGIVNNPVLNNLYWAVKGKGAFRNGEKISVSDCQQVKDANIAYEVSLLHVLDICDKHIKRMYHLGSGARRMLSYGTVVESMCYVASGNLDAYHIEDMYPWDCAAGYLLIREAGGVVYHPYGGDFQIMKPDLVCAGTESLCREIIGLIKKADESKSCGGN
ncbi:uncharacterized protein LOC129918252 [Episyrphus balteatus]|uniref:uncharacterized protein LOC129918252 n=1 Tax=Episyrphus balteatus TaxID=286459 RepID=UPI002485FA34|nr:uncharacterized protein LOC129918252 [Episyrphus balteatus]